MFFDKADEIPAIAAKNGSSIFVLPDSIPVSIKNSTLLEPESKSVITIEQIHEMLESFSLKRPSDQFVVIRPADKIGRDASGALLKSLEEPTLNLHFVLITENLTDIIPTIRSRSAIYFLRGSWSEYDDINASEKVKELAKKLISAKPNQLVGLANDIYSAKKEKKEFALKVVAASIEMLYKTYLITNKEVFIKRVPKFINLYENLSRNGNIKLHIVADLC